jgi:hypothetical protein
METLTKTHWIYIHGGGNFLGQHKCGQPLGQRQKGARWVIRAIERFGRDACSDKRRTVPPDRVGKVQ